MHPGSVWPMLGLRLWMVAALMGAALFASAIVGWRALEYERTFQNSARLRDLGSAAGLIASDIGPSMAGGRDAEAAALLDSAAEVTGAPTRRSLARQAQLLLLRRAARHGRVGESARRLAGWARA